jgi:hypothetical protein
MLIAADGDYPENFSLSVNYYEGIIKNLRWTDLGKVLAGDVFNIGDIQGKPSLEEARELGASL